ncbi:hypothetical protein BKA64DRAFT_648972 [Cadophora sp. MPI-SDFR-AT-0126]|nr:hypothetical protein BKA64DRAFT_648972 [Leotiomycetes sp. MPI-SDFR-AT-0126]
MFADHCSFIAGMRFAKLEMNMIVVFFVVAQDYTPVDKQGLPIPRLPPLGRNKKTASKPDTPLFLKYEKKKERVYQSFPYWRRTAPKATSTSTSAMKSASRKSSIPIPKFSSNAPTARKHVSIPRTPAGTSIRRPNLTESRIKTPAGASPRQQVSAQPSRKIPSAPNRVGASHPVRKGSLPQVPLNVARPSTSSPKGPSKIPGPSKPHLTIDTAGGRAQIPSQIPRLVNAQQAQQTQRSNHGPVQQRPGETKSLTGLLASTDQVKRVPPPVDIRTKTNASSANGASSRQPRPEQGSTQAEQGVGINAKFAGGKQLNGLAHTAGSTTKTVSQTRLSEQRAQPTSKNSDAGNFKGLAPNPTQSQAQSVSKSKKSFASIFKKNKTEAKAPESSLPPPNPALQNNKAAKTARSKEKKDEKAQVKEAKQSKHDNVGGTEKVKAKRAKTSGEESSTGLPQYDDLREDDRPKSHTTVNNIYVSNPARGVYQQQEPPESRHIHHVEEVHHYHSSPPRYSSPPPGYASDTDPRQVHIIGNPPVYEHDYYSMICHPNSDEPLTPKEFSKLPRVPIETYIEFSNLARQDRGARRSDLERLIPYWRFLIEAGNGREIATIEYNTERRPSKMRARKCKVAIWRSNFGRWERKCHL